MGQHFEAVNVQVALVGLDCDLAERIEARMKECRSGDVGVVEVMAAYEKLPDCRSALDAGKINAICLNAAKFPSRQVEEFIGSVRFTHPLVSICLVGRNYYLERLPDFRDPAKERLRHYFRLREDVTPFEDEVGAVRDLLVADRVKSAALNYYETTPGRMRSAAHNYDVFLSYANADLPTASVLYNKIRAADYRAYMTPEVDKHEDSAWEEVRLALRGTQELWLLLSDDSRGNEWVTTEWGTAWSWEIPICIFLHGCSRNDIPERLKEYNSFFVYQCDDVIKARLGHLPKRRGST
jgi:hypothetical protein